MAGQHSCRLTFLRENRPCQSPHRRVWHKFLQDPSHFGRCILRWWLHYKQMLSILLMPARTTKDRRIDQSFFSIDVYLASLKLWCAVCFTSLLDQTRDQASCSYFAGFVGRVAEDLLAPHRIDQQNVQCRIHRRSIPQTMTAINVESVEIAPNPCLAIYDM